MMDDVPILSHETYEQRKLDPTDEAVLHSAATGEGLVQLTPEGLRQLVEAAERTVGYCQQIAAAALTPERAAFVRQLRVVQEYSWRAVARACFDAWHGDWAPPSNQLMGMALCEEAAKHFHENYMDPPWN
jgi:hypothetical protein